MNTLILLAGLTLAGPAPETFTPAPSLDAAVAAGDNEAADRLLREAYDLFPDRRAWPRAARLLERSAVLRAEDDPARAWAFRMAGQVHAHMRDYKSAREAFQRSAEAASLIGAVADAAGAWLDAAEMALLLGQRVEALDLIEKSALLSRSPHLTDDQRREIVNRIPAEARAAG